ncbi:MAG: hypothetical protein DI547_04165 [Sphingobium sp.]|nr:MAG: hypothetical protein DI547_04165 [Sphingobium sp.]
MTATTGQSGRPLRFIALALLSWGGCRIAVENALPQMQVAWAADRIPPNRTTFPIVLRQAETMRPLPVPLPAAAGYAVLARREDALGVSGVRDPGGIGALAQVSTVSLFVSPPAAAPSSIVPATVGDAGRGADFAAAPPSPVAGARADRWSLDAWLLWRDGSGDIGLSSAGQLGASQAGARLQYDLTPDSHARIAAYSRVTSALGDPAAPEAGLGFAYQPSRNIPVSFAVERRVALGKGGRDAFAIMGITGFGPVETPGGLEAEGYAQAGIVGARRRDAFVDGRLSLLQPVFEKIGAGIAISGGAQPRLGRLDIGPAIQARLSTKRTQSRMAAEWRRRITGRARPGSGLTITLAASF